MTNSPTGPAYRIETDRLVIRCWHPQDAALLKQAVDESLDHLRPWMPWAAHEPTTLQVKIDLLRRTRGKFDLGEDFTYGILNKDETKALGGTGLHTRLGDDAREIGYWIHQDYARQGLTTEVVLALTKVAFEIDQVARVEIHCASDNIGSAGVAQKAGYALKETRLIQTPEGLPRDTMIWVLQADQYPASPAAKIPIKAFDAAGRPLT